MSHHTAESPPNTNPMPAKRFAGLRWAKGNRTLFVLCLAVSIFLIGCPGRSLGASTAGWSPVAAEDGVVYVGTLEGEVKALEDRGDNGVGLKWTFSGTSEDPLEGVFGTPAIGPELVYISALNGVLYALDKESGDSLGKGWQRPVGPGLDREPLVGGPALNETGTVVVVGSEAGNLYSFIARTGEPLGEPLFTADDKIWSTPVIRNGIVYFGSHDGNVYAVNLETGELKWRFATGGAVVASPLLFKDLVVVGSFDKNLHAIDAKNGIERWRFEGSHWFWAGAVANDSAIFAPSMDGYVYSLDKNGNLLWKWQREKAFPIVATPVLTPTGLVVAEADKDGSVTLWNTNPGELGSGRIKTVLLGLTAEVRAPLFAVPSSGAPSSGEATPEFGQAASLIDQRDSVFMGDKDGKVRRIRLRDTRELWCFDTKEGLNCS